MRVEQVRRSGERERGSEILDIIQHSLGSIRFGTIALTVHEGRVTQLEITEKRRFGH